MLFGKEEEREKGEEEEGRGRRLRGFCGQNEQYENQKIMEKRKQMHNINTIRFIRHEIKDMFFPHEMNMT